MSNWWENNHPCTQAWMNAFIGRSDGQPSLWIAMEELEVAPGQFDLDHTGSSGVFLCQTELILSLCALDL